MSEAAADLPAPAEVLVGIPLFAGLDPADVNELTGALEPFALRSGECLFAQNDLGTGAYLVVSGTLVASARTPGDGQRELARIGAGGVIGEFSLLDGGRRSAEVHAQGAVRGYRLDYERFAALRAGQRSGALAVLARLRTEVAQRIAATLSALGLADEGPGPDAAAGEGEAADAGECARLLGLFPGFDRFSPSDWQDFADRARRWQVPRGAVLAPSGERRQAVHVVARGALREAIGATHLLVYGPGSLAGCAGLLVGGGWSSRLEAREEATVFAVADPPDRLTEMIGPQLTRDLRRLSRIGNRALDPALEVG